MSRSFAFGRGAGLVLALLLSAPALAAENLLLNATFDSNVNGWFPADGGAVITQTTTNADGAHPAGSALVSKIGGGTDYAFQCVSVTGGVAYEFSGDVFLRAGSNTDEQAQIALKFYSGASCTNLIGGYQTDPVTTHLTWTTRAATVSAPGSATTGAFALVISATTVQEAQFDNVALSRVKRGDANGDGTLDVADVFYLINFLFAAGPPPPLP